MWQNLSLTVMVRFIPILNTKRTLNTTSLEMHLEDSKQEHPKYTSVSETTDAQEKGRTLAWDVRIETCQYSFLSWSKCLENFPSLFSKHYGKSELIVRLSRVHRQLKRVTPSVTLLNRIVLLLSCMPVTFIFWRLANLVNRRKQLLVRVIIYQEFRLEAVVVMSTPIELSLPSSNALICDDITRSITGCCDEGLYRPGIKPP